MRLFSGKITPLSEDLVKAVTEGGDVECEDKKEVARDIESVLTNYLAIDRDVMEKTKATLESRGLPQSEFGRIRKIIAEQKGIKVGDDMLDHLLDQCIEMLLHSNNVEEVFCGDHDLRRKMRPIMRKYLEADEALDVEVRSKLKHVQEGSRTWEIEYKRIAGDIQRRKGLS